MSSQINESEARLNCLFLRFMGYSKALKPIFKRPPNPPKTGGLN